MEEGKIAEKAIKDRKASRSLLTKGISMVAVIAILVLINIKYINVSPAGFSDWLGNFPIIAPVVFLGLYIIRAIFLVPITIFYITGGLAFGPVEATLYAAIGGGIGAIIIYLFARFCDLDELFHKLSGNRLDKIQNQLEDNGFLYIFLLRNLPIANFDLISYLAGLSRTPFRQFVLGSFFGNIPIAYLYGYIGFTFSQGEYFQGIVITILVLVAMSIVSIYLKKNNNKKAQMRKEKDKLNRG